jgi:hypothetical protein
MTEQRGSTAISSSTEQKSNKVNRPGQREMFHSIQEAQAVKPASAKQRVFEILKSGQSRGFVWGIVAQPQ